VRSHTRYHFVYTMGLPRGGRPVWDAADASAGEAGMEIGEGSGAAAKSAKSGHRQYSGIRKRSIVGFV
jgi:hypothetical protein